MGIALPVALLPRTVVACPGEDVLDGVFGNLLEFKGRFTRGKDRGETIAIIQVSFFGGKGGSTTNTKSKGRKWKKENVTRK